MKTWFPFTLVIALLIETAHPRLAAAPPAGRSAAPRSPGTGGGRLPRRHRTGAARGAVAGKVEVEGPGLIR